MEFVGDPVEDAAAAGLGGGFVAGGGDAAVFERVQRRWREAPIARAPAEVEVPGAEGEDYEEEDGEEDPAPVGVVGAGKWVVLFGWARVVW